MTPLRWQAVTASIEGQGPGVYKAKETAYNTQSAKEGARGTDVSFAIIPKDVNYANEFLIRALKKEPYILWGVGCVQSGMLLTVPPGNHRGARLLTCSSCFRHAPLGGRKESYGTAVKLEAVFEIME